ncbi:hypothetical protein [Mycobacterium sp. UM_CSW]|uniref:hypothetical protein n=1 Tax=Mycobacterium sp. UM_CSW TaxID=1370119 RepID=UPI0012692319|nr:hypothetical protein [Mycobacterium sp. UM_CSW]
MPAFIMHDGELLQLVDQLDLAETILAAQAFDDLRRGPLVPPDVQAWARWWSYRLHTRLGDAPAHPQEAFVSRDLSPQDRQLLVVCFERIADGTHVGPGLRAFANAVAVQLLAVGLDVQADDHARTADLEAWIAERRRERPHGTPGDTSQLPEWSDITEPGDPPDANPWV